MKFRSFFPEHIQLILEKNPPGEWLPTIPPGCIRLSAGYPAPDLVPYEQIQDATANLIKEEGDLPFHYIGSPHIPRLKNRIKGRLAIRGIEISDEELLVTSGACQAIDLIARILLDEQSVVALEAPTYMEALEIFQNYTSQFMSVPVDEQGLDTRLLEKRLAEREEVGEGIPRFLYTIPSFQNPTGTTMPPDRRRHLLKLAEKYDFLVVEDDAYGELSFHEKPVPLKAMDEEGRVIHIGSLSKIVAPGLRIGWVAGAKEIVEAAAWFKKDLNHPFAQSSMEAFLAQANFDERLDELTERYREKCAALVSSLETHLSGIATWTVPEGGYFVWLKLSGIDTGDLLEIALEEGVSYVPGKYFYLNQPEGNQYLRLSFSNNQPAEIEEGIQKLAKAIKKEKGA